MKRNGSWIVVGLVVGGLVFSGSARADLIGFWKFDEGTGEKAADSSGQGKDGTIVNPTKGLGDGVRSAQIPSPHVLAPRPARTSRWARTSFPQ